MNLELTSPPSEPRRIVGVAIRLESGEVRSLPRPARHFNLFAESNENGRAHGWDFPWAGWPADEEMRRGEQGFISDSGRFLSRREAYEHALACGQPRRLRGPRGEDMGWGKFEPHIVSAFSEDFW